MTSPWTGTVHHLACCGRLRCRSRAANLRVPVRRLRGDCTSRIPQVRSVCLAIDTACQLRARLSSSCTFESALTLLTTRGIKPEGAGLRTRVQHTPHICRRARRRVLGPGSRGGGGTVRWRLIMRGGGSRRGPQGWHGWCRGVRGRHAGFPVVAARAQVEQGVVQLGLDFDACVAWGQPSGGGAHAAGVPACAHEGHGSSRAGGGMEMILDTEYACTDHHKSVHVVIVTWVPTCR